MSNALEPSDFLRMCQHHWREELSLLKGKEPLWRCHDCKRWIPRDELPLRCSECSGPDLPGKKIGYRVRKIKQDAMVCKNCVDKHEHIREAIFNFQLDAMRHGIEKRAMQKVFAENPQKYLVKPPNEETVN